MGLEVKQLRVGSLDVACKVEGPPDADAVLLMHGILCDHRIYDGLAALLVPRYRVVRYDVRGHGGSSATPAPYTMRELADDAAGVVDALGIRRAHAIGTSLGGMIGQQLGAHHGDRLLTLTLANNAAHQAMPAAWEERIAIARAQGTAALAQSTLERWFTPAYRARAPQEMERVAAMIAATSVEGFAGCATAVRNLAHLDLLPSIRVPTLVVVGSQDAAAPPAQGEQIRAGIPGAQLVAIDAAHQAAAEQPQAFFDAWQAFATQARA